MVDRAVEVAGVEELRYDDEQGDAGAKDEESLGSA